MSDTADLCSPAFFSDDNQCWEKYTEGTYVSYVLQDLFSFLKFETKVFPEPKRLSTSSGFLLYYP